MKLKLPGLAVAVAVLTALASFVICEPSPRASSRRLALRTAPVELFDEAMSGPSNAKKGAMFDLWLGNSTPVTVYLAAMTVMPADDGTGGTECTIGAGGYARIAITNNTTNFPNATAANPSVKSLAVGFSFPPATADWMSAAPIVGYALYDAATAGTFLGSAYALTAPAIFDVASNTFTTTTSHGYAANDAVRFVFSAGSTVPTGINTTTTYYVLAAGLTATAFQVSLTQGGAAVTVSTAGVGLKRVFKSYVGPVTNGTTLMINANQLQFQLAGF